MDYTWYRCTCACEYLWRPCTERKMHPVWLTTFTTMPSDRRSLPCTMLSLKKYLKRARLFEVQKLTKRIRAAEKKRYRPSNEYTNRSVPISSTLISCRGTELQLAKNQRKVQRLQHELELVKVGLTSFSGPGHAHIIYTMWQDVDIGELCSRIQANDIQTIRLATQKQVCLCVCVCVCSYVSDAVMVTCYFRLQLTLWRRRRNGGFSHQRQSEGISRSSWRSRTKGRVHLVYRYVEMAVCRSVIVKGVPPECHIRPLLGTRH